jgi:hypothetical protein
MKDSVDTLFDSRVLAKLPLLYRLLAELETEQVGELRVNSRFSTSRRHYSENYLNMPFWKPISTVDPDPLFKNEE